jgi:hypothetical protein
MKTKTAKKSVGSKHEIVVRVSTTPAVPTVSDLSEPMRDGRKLTIPATWLNESQIMKLVQVTPKEHVYKRKARGGGMWDYVTGSYIEKVLNFVFGWNWDFDVIEHGREQNCVWVKGRLTVHGTKEGQQIVKTQFGRAEVKYLKGTKEMLDYGNDLKAATTDALKKCASLLGIASDIYGKTDYRQETGNEPVEITGTPIKPPQPVQKPQQVTQVKTPPLKSGQVIGPGGVPVYTCHDCASIIDELVANYSSRIYGKPLCKNCQGVSKAKK